VSNAGAYSGVTIKEGSMSQSQILDKPENIPKANTPTYFTTVIVEENKTL
jgi:hypothetical protein